VRFVGDPETRIKEDVLRLLRFFRFHAHYGKGEPDPAALAACRKLAQFLPTLSGERVAGELLRLLGAPDPASALDLMQKNGVLKHVLPEAGPIRKLAALAALEAGLGGNDPLLRLAAVLRPEGAAAQTVAERLRLSKAERERLAALVAPETPVTVTEDSKIHRRELYRLGSARYRDLALLVWAAGPEAGEAPFRAMLASLREWKPKELPIKGRDVLALGVENGPRIGHFLHSVEEWWVGNDFAPDRTACLEKLRKLAAH
jgi:poly(A) polymerase